MRLSFSPLFLRLSHPHSSELTTSPSPCSIVKNDSVSRAIVKGILDGDLLATFETLPLEYQNELAAAVGTDADTVRANLRNLRGFE